MRPSTLIPCLLAAFLFAAGPVWPGQEQPKQSQSEQTGAAKNQAGNAKNEAQAPVAPQDALAEAARKARAAQQNAPTPDMVFTNDNIPTPGGISSVGPVPQGASSPSGSAANEAKVSPKSAPANDEQTWRARFSGLRHKLDQDQAELDIMQRELGVLNVQFYSDPTKQMQQQLSREDINKKTAAIEEKKKQVAADQQAISDAEEALRRAGGDPGWANPQ